MIRPRPEPWIVRNIEWLGPVVAAAFGLALMAYAMWGVK